MNVVRRWSTRLLVICASAGVAHAQLPGLPYSPWQTGVGYFVGPYGTGGAAGAATAGGVFCTDISHVLQYGYLWSHFLTPVGPNNATPTGYSYEGLGGQCGTPGANAFSPFGAAFMPLDLPPGLGPDSQNPLDHPSTPQGEIGPLPNVAAFRYLPAAPPYDPPTDPPTEEPPVITPPVLGPHVTPEPATWVLLGTGLVAILGFAALKGTRL